MTKTKSAAVLTIIDAAKMTTKGKKQIADWLRKQAQALIRDGKLYAKRCVIRYRYEK